MIYNSIVAIQISSIILLILILFYLFRRQTGEMLHIMIFLCAALIINQTGYLLEMLSRDANSAMVAIRFAYLGKQMALLFIFIFQMTFCGIRLPRKVTYPLSSIHFFIVAAVWTNDYHHLFYSSVDYTQDGLFPHVVLGHGWIYYLFMFIILVYLIIMLAVCAVRFKRLKDVVSRRKIALVVINPLISLVALILWFTGITKGYDATALGYLFQTLLMLYALIKYDIVSPIDAARGDIVENFRDPIFILNETEDILYSNKSFKKMMHLLSADEQAVEMERIKKTCEEADNYELNDCIYRIKKNIISPKDSYKCYVYVLDDITEIDRTQRSLMQAREEAVSANRAKSAFLANMSHEIRTPINAVLGMDTMILRKSKDAEIRKYAGDIQSAGKNLLSIINDILDFSKIESGKMELVPVDYDFSSLINDVYNMISNKARDKDLEFVLEIDENIPCRMYGDDVRIRQILVNLLTNAVKYTPSGKVTLIIERKTGTSGKDGILYFAVKDTGIGIKPEDISKLTEEFVRIEESRNRNIEGTGLGINIVVSMLALMGSKLEVESVYGEGSTFYFDLNQPVTSEDVIGNISERINSNFSENEEYSTSFCFPDARLLVVDDNPMNLSVFSSLLSDMLCQIDEADSGAKCLELVKENKYDIIFMDHMMPEMDGIETFHHMQELEQAAAQVAGLEAGQEATGYPNADTPVIILTANAISGAKEAYLSEGFTDYMSKPIDADKLEALIEKLIPEEKKQPVKKLVTEAGAEGATDTVAGAGADEELPFIDGVDWKHALSKLKSQALLLESVKNFSNMAKMDLKVLTGMYERLEASGGQSSEAQAAFDEYRIKVHAMKSNVATIGADHVAGLAKYLEYAAKDYDLGTIRNLMSLFVSEWKRLCAEIDEAFGYHQEEVNGAEDRNPIDTDELELLLDALRESMEEADLDRADAVVEELSAYSYPEDQAELLEEIKMAVLNIDSEQIEDIIQRWNSLIK